MSEMITFYAIREEDLAKTPKAVKDFVQDFFERKEIFGTPCFVAAGATYKAPWACMNKNEYVDGLSEVELNNCGIFTWIENHPDIIFVYSWS
jgi:hypothetical protein